MSAATVDRRKLRVLLLSDEKVSTVGTLLNCSCAGVWKVARYIGLRLVWTTKAERELLAALRSEAPDSLQAEDPAVSVDFFHTVARALRAYGQTEQRDIP